MPYILVHPLPPPRRNPYAPNLPTFTTSSRAIAHFFHSHGWRARHLHADGLSTISSAPPSLTSSRSSSLCSARSTHSTGSNSYIEASSLSSNFHGPNPEPEHAPTECCLADSGSSVLSCGPVVELHCYLIPLNTAVFQGPPATAMQVRYLRWYAYPHINFNDENGDVDLCLPNLSALALQRDADEDFWRGERKANRQRRRRECEAQAAKDLNKLREPGEERGLLSIPLSNVLEVARPQREPVKVAKLMERDRELRQDAKCLDWKCKAKPGVVHGEEVDVDDDDDDGEECSQLVSTEQDDEIDEELSEQWEMCELALLASEGLEWTEDGRTLRRTMST